MTRRIFISYFNSTPSIRERTRRTRFAFFLLSSPSLLGVNLTVHESMIPPPMPKNHTAVVPLFPSVD